MLSKLVYTQFGTKMTTHYQLFFQTGRIALFRMVSLGGLLHRIRIYLPWLLCWVLLAHPLSHLLDSDLAHPQRQAQQAECSLCASNQPLPAVELPEISFRLLEEAAPESLGKPSVLLRKAEKARAPPSLRGAIPA